MIKYIITDFDGTLVDTHSANEVAYREAFSRAGYKFSDSKYAEAFGLRFDDMCDCLGVPNDASVRKQIKEAKKEIYPHCFDKLRLNGALCMIMSLLPPERKIIASTASKENLGNVMMHFGLGCIDAVTGEDVEHGKPAPDVYLKALEKLGNPNADEVIVFEDTDIGIQAAEAAGLKNVVKVSIDDWRNVFKIFRQFANNRPERFK